jgi:hypothetical protein
MNFACDSNVTQRSMKPARPVSGRRRRLPQAERRARNRQTILSLVSYIRSRETRRAMSYAEAARRLNDAGRYPATGKPWTERGLYRMLQRMGYAGLHGLTDAMRAGEV